MRLVCRQSSANLLLIHGGAGPQDPDADRLRQAVSALRSFAQDLRGMVTNGSRPLEIVLAALTRLEADPQFNAGFGSALQQDGQARMSAALMDSERETFSGVIGASYIHHPSQLAASLQSQRDRVLMPPGVDLLARQYQAEIAIRPEQRRAEQWLEKWRQGEQEVRRDPWNEQTCDTVGCIVRIDGQMAAGTSTGGRGFEFPGRVSDSATVAGNYCSRFAAVSVTGVGEEIIDDAVAARMETRCRDGMTLTHASQQAFADAQEKARHYGWIAADRDGWSVGRTTRGMSFVVLDGDQLLDDSSLSASDSKTSL